MPLVNEAASATTVAVAGASGFVGQAIGKALAGRHRLVGLSRGGGRAHYDEWRKCDLFSLRDAERGLEGARFAVYLVHSMMPSARLVQGRFEDLDLICADNFARAAKRAGVEQIVYLGGLVPPHDGELSRHLQSRREVEAALGGHGVPVTVLRAGLVLGAGGSSFELMTRLVKRLPLMVTPSWTATRCQPIALTDVAAIITYVLGRKTTYDQTYDIGGPEVLTYREMLQQTAEALGLSRRTVAASVLSPRLSTLWVSVVSSTPSELVGPLVQSLSHAMIAGDRRLQEEAGIPGKTFREGLEEALHTPPADREAAQKPVAAPPPPHSAAPSGVRSVQRLPLPAGRNAEWVAAEYMRWLPRLHGLRVVVEPSGICRFYARSVKEPLLELSLAPDRSTPDRQLFYITGGLLAKPTDRGRLEFRETADHTSVLAAIHEYHPRLPWWLYENSQAVAHLWVMNAFAKHLATCAGAQG